MWCIAPTIRSGATDETRSADTYLQFDRLPAEPGNGSRNSANRNCEQLTASPQIRLIGVGMEVRHCYATGDSKRTQADEAMARHLLVSGILPIMPLFCDQSNPGIVQRYRSVWVIKQGMESYDMIREMSGYDFYDFMKRNKSGFPQTCRGSVTESNGVMQQTLFDAVPRFTNRSTKAVTFQGKLGLADSSVVSLDAKLFPATCAGYRLRVWLERKGFRAGSF